MKIYKLDEFISQKVKITSQQSKFNDLIQDFHHLCEQHEFILVNGLSDYSLS